MWKSANEVGIEDIINLPILPLNTLKEEQRRILDAIGGGGIESPAITSRKKTAFIASEIKSRSGSIVSLDKLVLLLNPNIRKGSDAFATECSRLSHHLKNFEALGLVTKAKSGKNVVVRLTGLGEMFV